MVDMLSASDMKDIAYEHVLREVEREMKINISKEGKLKAYSVPVPIVVYPNIVLFLKGKGYITTLVKTDNLLKYINVSADTFE